MPPTASLDGLHFRGVVQQRIIANYRLPVDLVRPLVPEDADLWTGGPGGDAWVSACFVQMRHVRPAGVPPWAGASLRYLVHRTMARVPFPDGRRRKAVYVLAAYASPMLPRVAARILGGAPFAPATITWGRTADGFRVRAERQGEVLYDATTRRAFASAVFADVAQADEAILGMAWGSYKRREWKLFPETHEPWDAYGLRQTTARNAFLQGLGAGGVEADHVLAMERSPHSFGRPVRVPQAAR